MTAQASTATAPLPVTPQMVAKARGMFGSELIDSMIERGMVRIVDQKVTNHGSNSIKN